MAVRKTITPTLRFEVFKRDSFTCQYCWKHPPEVVLNVDHINAVVKGGKNDIDNLITACVGCNQGKSSKSLSAIPHGLKVRASSILEQEMQIRGYNEAMALRRERIDRDCWTLIREMYGSNTDTFRTDWLESIRRFAETFSFDELIRAAQAAKAKTIYGSDLDKFRYFCGICWSKLRQRGI